MDLPLAADLQGQPLGRPAVLTVDWRGWMKFDGSTAAFERFGGCRRAAAPVASRDDAVCPAHGENGGPVAAADQFRGAQAGSAAASRGQSAACGGATMENRTFDAAAATQVLRAAAGRRPGSQPSQRRIERPAAPAGSTASAAGPTIRSAAWPAPRPARPAAAAPAPRPDQLHCLHVKFQGAITGNLLRRQVTFHDQVQTSYGPVDNWDAMLTTDDPDRLGPRGVTVRCDQLSVVQMLLPVGGRRAVELEALGNTVVENTTFIARGNRITYAEAKDLLILEGNGLSDAELWRQLQVGLPASKTAAKKIWYWPKTNRLSVDGLRLIEAGQLPGNN